MSIIIGAISKKFGIIVSDSRIFESAQINDGKIIKQAIPREGDFDKTFELKDGQIIGAYAGLMEFNDLTIIDQINEIISDVETPQDNFDSLVEKIFTALKDRLDGIDTEKVIFSERLLKVILISSYNYQKTKFIIYTLSYIPTKDDSGNYNIVPNKDRGASDDISKDKIYKSIQGDDEACKASNNYFENTFKKRYVISFGFIKSLLETGLKIAIRKSGIHKYGSEQSCGGSLNFKKITRYNS